MITIKGEAQLRRMRRAGAILYDVLCHLCEMVRPGITTLEIDEAARRMIQEEGAIPSFLGYNGFPASVCASPDEVVVHGIPSAAPIAEGSILSLDLGVIWEGYQADSARTVPVGTVSPEAQRLILETERCFWLGAAQARAGRRVSDISWAVESHARSCGYGVVRDLCGHGIGETMHEDPEVPNFGLPGRGVRLKSGMTIAIEPMIVMGGDPVVFDKADGWTVRTADGGWCSHYEHTLAVTGKGPPEILTLPEGLVPAGVFNEAVS